MNDRGQTEYEDALIFKTFIFQFANAYFAMYYTAFIKASPLLKRQLDLTVTRTDPSEI